MDKQPSTDPIDVINDLGCTLEQVRGIVEVVTDSMTADGAPDRESPLSFAYSSLHGALELLRGGQRRCCDARPIAQTDAAATNREATIEAEAQENIIRYCNSLHADELLPAIDSLDEFIQLQREHASPILMVIRDRLRDVSTKLEQNGI